MSEATAKPKGFRLPILGGILPLDSKQFPVDIIAGITLAALAIPEVMGYTSIAGMPVITGLYTIVLPISVFALLGSSRHLVVGADSATAAIMFAGLTGLAQPQSAEWVALAGWLALLTAAYLLLARVLKLGFLADFLSRTVLIGFLTGVGIQVACGQLPGMFGVTKTGHGPIAQAFNAIKELPQANTTTLIVSAVVIVLIAGGKLISKKIPWALIAVVGTIAASAYFDLAAKGVTTLGTVPSGLPKLAIPALPATGTWSVLAATSLSLFFVILAQSAATSRAYAVKYDDVGFKENTDLVGLSLANVAAGISGTFVVNGSPTKTQMVDSAGGKTQVSQLTTAAIVVIVLLFLTKPLSYMPNAVLASVVFLIGIELVDLLGMRGILKVRPVEFWVALITAATVVVVGVEQGIVLAIVLSMIAHVRHSYRPHNALVTWDAEGPKSHPLKTMTEARPGLAVYHFGAGIYYANSQVFQEEVLDLVAHLEPKIEWFVLEASGIGDVDYTAAETMRKLVSLLKEKGVRFAVCNLMDEVYRELEVSGLTDEIGRDAFYPTLPMLLDAYDAQHGGGGSKASAAPTSGTDTAK
jgi:sulfate permease, SulP family